MATAGQGYQWEAHEVTTSTGYELTLFRITGDNLGTPRTADLGPVLLVHGLYSDVFDWLTTGGAGPVKPISMHDSGYDVWIAVTRGRLYSKGHTTLSATDPLTKDQYWDYTFVEIGTEDIPAMLDKIIEN